jgi:hypothetical protein
MDFPDDKPGDSFNSVQCPDFLDDAAKCTCLLVSAIQFLTLLFKMPLPVCRRETVWLIETQSLSRFMQWPRDLPANPHALAGTTKHEIPPPTPFGLTFRR